MGIHLVEVQVDAIDQFLFAGDADATEHSSRHLAEHGFHDVQPGAVLGCEDELEPLRVKAKVSSRFLGNVRRMIVQQQPNPGLRRILGVCFPTER